MPMEKNRKEKGEVAHEAERFIILPKAFKAGRKN